MNPMKNRKKMFEIFFEKFQAPAVFVAIQGVLSLYLYSDVDSPLENQQELFWILEMELLMLFPSMKDIH